MAQSGFVGGFYLIMLIVCKVDVYKRQVVNNGREVLSNVISSQIELHKLYGGVVPEIASRKHIEKINQVIEQALKDEMCIRDRISRTENTRQRL